MKFDNHILGHLFSFCLAITILWIFSCAETEKKEQYLKFNRENFEHFIASKPKSYTEYIIIPGSGCQGCISQAEQFVIDHAERSKDKKLFIFTNIVSQKMLKLKLGEEILGLPNIIYDSSDELHFMSTYPQLIRRDTEGELVATDLGMNDMVLMGGS